MKLQTCSDAGASQLVPWEDYIASLQLSKVSGWRIRKRGWIETVTLCGKCYATRDEIQRFEARVAAGEFEPLRQQISNANRRSETQGEVAEHKVKASDCQPRTPDRSAANRNGDQAMSSGQTVQPGTATDVLKAQHTAGFSDHAHGDPGHQLKSIADVNRFRTGAPKE